jgi:hypothetical protein
VFWGLGRKLDCLSLHDTYRHLCVGSASPIRKKFGKGERTGMPAAASLGEKLRTSEAGAPVYSLLERSFLT